MKRLKWNDIAPHPSNVLIAGDVGTGKTALAGTYIDYARSEKLKCYSVRRPFPHSKQVNETFEAPHNACVLVDDAHLTELYAHLTGTKTKRIYDYMQRQKRHRNHSIIYTTQETTGFGIRLIRLLDAICLFPPPMMAHEYERSRIRAFYTAADKALKPWKLGKVWIRHKNRETHEVTEDVYTFSLPSWWDEDASVPKQKKNYRNRLISPVLDIVRAVGRITK